MDRLESSRKKYPESFRNKPEPGKKTDPELMDMPTLFIFGEVFYTVNFSDIRREPLDIIALASNHTPQQLKAHVTGNQQSGNSKNILYPAIVHLIPYIVFPESLDSIYIFTTNTTK